jgi:tetratricopeptide (TPR) repeat protein
MKAFIYAILGLAVIGGGIALTASRQKKPVVPPTQTVRESPPSPAVANHPPQQRPQRPVASSVPVQSAPAAADESRPAEVASAVEPGAKPVDPAIKQAIENLLSAPLTHEQRRSLLKQLNQAGLLDQAISQLEQMAAGDPNNAGYATALGQAYLEKGQAIMTTDVANGSILAMQAVQSFDAALSNDPANWEARFTRTAILEHFPAELNKGQEVIDQFTQLIDQQEKQPAQPQFANSYVLLGDQYQKLGKTDYAQATWQAGAAVFPNDASLQKRLAGQ